MKFRAIFLAPVAAVALAMAMTAFANDREILTELYHATDGDNWAQRNGWLEAESLCDWHGVQCRVSSTGVEQVRALDLDWNRLNGSLPASLAELEALNRLNLRGNALAGQVPTELIQGLAANEDFGVGGVLVIDLGENRLSGAPPELVLPVSSRPLDLYLDSNQINGPLPVSWSMLPLRSLLLDRNPLGVAPPPEWSAMTDLKRLGLSTTQLTGPLPETLSTLTALEELDLSNNALSGELPDWLGQANLRRLNLEANQLEGSIAPAVEAMRQDGVVGLNLADNQFSGILPDRLFDLTFAPATGRAIFTGQDRLDLCWNNFDATEAGFEELIGQGHHGGSFIACQGEVQALSPEISGSWYLPERAGEGYSKMLLENGSLLVYWFTFPPQQAVAAGDQAWFFSVVDPRSAAATLTPMYATSGQFGQGIAGPRANPVDLRLTVHATAENDLHTAYSLAWPAAGSITGLVLNDHHSRSDRLTSLTRLAGSRCDNQVDQQWISGAWFNPEQVGEGLIVEVNEDGRGVVYWFTHVPESSGNFQAWMTGDAVFDGQTLFVDNLLMPTGTRFGTDFDGSEIDVAQWGSLTLQFDNDLSGHAWFDSELPEYGSGDFSLSRLARAQLADCSGE